MILTKDSIRCIKSVVDQNLTLQELDHSVVNRLNKIYKDIHFKWINLKEGLPDKILITDSVKKILIDDALQSPFISDQIKKNIRKINGKMYMYQINEQINLYWYNTTPIRRNLLSSLLKRLIITKNLVNPKHEGVDIIVIPTKNKKIRDGKLDLNAVNSGSSWSRVNNKSMIYIWREEELNKVAVHEMIHGSLGDRDIYNNPKYDQIIKEWLCLDDQMINVNETFVEVLTNLLHSMFVACDLEDNNWMKYLSAERGYSQIMASCVLKDLGYKKFSDLESINSKCNDRLHLKTSVVSYYILRAGVLYLFNDYIKVMGDDLFRFKNIRGKGFIDVIKRGYSKLKVLDVDDHHMMRMTCLQIEFL